MRFIKRELQEIAMEDNFTILFEDSLSWDNQHHSENDLNEEIEMWMEINRNAR